MEFEEVYTYILEEKACQHKPEREENVQSFKIFFGVWNELCYLFIYKEKSPLTYE